VALVKEKISTLGEYPAYAGFFFSEPAADGSPDSSALLDRTVEALAGLEPFAAEPIEAALREVADELGLSPRKAFQPIRVAVTGSTVSPGLFESIELLGRDVALARLRAATGARS
jgi:glutamyl-tRNA synthetase